MYDPKDRVEKQLDSDEEVPDTQPAPVDPGSVMVIDDDGEYD